MDPVTIGAIIGAGTGLIDRFISRGDIAKQNAYNSPKEQLSRLREAGLPMAAMTGQTSGNQSVIPEQGNFKGSIAEGMRTSTQLAQIKILKEEARLKSSEADLNEARRDFLLKGIGEPVAGTNLTSNLQAEQALQRNQIEGGRFANMIAGVTARNAQFKTNLENQGLVLDLQKRLGDIALNKYQQEGANLENDIKKVLAAYQPEMSREQLKKIIKENTLLDETTEGKQLENFAKVIENRILGTTEEARTRMIQHDIAMKELTWEKMQAEFNNYQEYQEFVRIVREQFKGNNGFMTKKAFEALAALAYTTVTGVSGNTPGIGTILQGIK